MSISQTSRPLFAYILCATALLSAGCQTESQTGTLVGTGVGAGLGAAIGGAIGGEKGALIGAGAGAVVGGVSGYAIGKSAEEDRARAKSDKEFIQSAIALAEKDRAEFAQKNTALSTEVSQLRARRDRLQSSSVKSDSELAAINSSVNARTASANQTLRAIDERIGYLQSVQSQLGTSSDPEVKSRMGLLESEVAELSKQKDYLISLRNDLIALNG